MLDKFYLEIRCGIGGLESSLFAQELFSMYMKFIKKNNFKFEVSYVQYNDLKGIKEAMLYIEGNISLFKGESGVHKVQRISKTESKEKRHTSTVTIAIIPYIAKSTFNLNLNDVVVQTFKAHGSGGQHVNTTDSAVRIIHKPTNTIVVNQNERSQHQNKEKAFEILKSKLENLFIDKAKKEINNSRQKQVQSGERSDSIRTYSYIRFEVTNHLNDKKGNLKKVLNGNLECLI
jgi:peptide chain release factor 1